MAKRVYLLVVDGLGVGAMPDSGTYGDVDSNTLAAVTASSQFVAPNLQALGLFNIAGAAGGEPSPQPVASYGRLAMQSAGKDSTVGHWEMAGVITPEAMPTFPQGFDNAITDHLYVNTFYRMLCCQPYDEAKVLQDFGREHIRTSKAILYTAADSVMNIAAHESMVPLRDLYEICDVARAYMQRWNGVARVVARPFIGDPPDFKFTMNRKDYSLAPHHSSMLDILRKRWLDVVAIGKVYDLFTGLGITRTIKAKNHLEAMEQAKSVAKLDFSGLCYVNISSYERRFGGYEDVDTFAAAISQFDQNLGELAELLGPEDIIIITADHGSDPGGSLSPHSREYLPLLVLGDSIRQGVDLGTRTTSADIAATVQDYFGLEVGTKGTSFLQDVLI